MKNKNLIIGAGLIGLAIFFYMKNKKEGVLTVGADSGVSNMCGQCS